MLTEKRSDGMKKYKITMKTPIGLRYGSMEVDVADDNVIGNINLLGQTKPFSGTIDIDGKCTIVGQLTTLIKNINFTAVGKITDKEIELSLKGERNIFKITGIAEESEEK